MARYARPLYVQTMSDADVNDQVGKLVAQGVIAVLAACMVKDPDVTDDVAAREAFAFLRHHLGRHGESLSPAEVTRWVERSASTIRVCVCRAVAAAIDEDPGASDEDVATFSHMILLRDVGAHHEAVLGLDFAMHLTRRYLAQCRRSGLTPLRWCEAFEASVRDGAWAFRRDASG